MGSLAEYQILKGDVKLAALDSSGNPLAFSDRGEAAILELTPTAVYAENKRTGKAGPNEIDLYIPVERALDITLTLKELSLANLLDYTHGGDKSEVAGAYSANGAFPTGILAGESYLIPGGHNGISAVIIKDGSGSPATLALNTNYTYDADSGLVTFVSLGVLVQPFTAFSYSYKKATGASILSTTPGEKCLVFDGINLAVPGEKVFVRLDRVAFMPAAKIALKDANNNVNEYELKGKALLGIGKTQSDGYGVYRQF